MTTREASSSLASPISDNTPERLTQEAETWLRVLDMGPNRATVGTPVGWARDSGDGPATRSRRSEMKDETKPMVWKPARDEARQLRKAGYDGLYSPGECACLIEDLYPCGERHKDCRPGYKGNCTDECEHEGAGEGNWHISAEREKVQP